MALQGGRQPRTHAGDQARCRPLPPRLPRAPGDGDARASPPLPERRSPRPWPRAAGSDPGSGRRAQARLLAALPQTVNSGLASLALTSLARPAGLRERWDAEGLVALQPPPHRPQPPLSWRFVDTEYRRRRAGLDAAPSGRSSRASAPPGGPASAAPFQRSASEKSFG